MDPSLFFLSFFFSLILYLISFPKIRGPLSPPEGAAGRCGKRSLTHLRVRARGRERGLAAARYPAGESSEKIGEGFAVHPEIGTE